MTASIVGAGSYLRSAQTWPSTKILTPADALPPLAAEDENPAVESVAPGIPVSDLKLIDKSKLKLVSVADNPELRDRMATAWLNTQAAEARMATQVSDDAPQNTYATVKVNGRVVATLFNGGSVTMTNEAAGLVGTFEDPPGLGGPNLAQWRAEAIARATGGTIEKASTALTQSEWTPRPSFTTGYTRAELDAAFQAMMAEGQKATAQRATYAGPRASAGTSTNFSA